MAAPAAAPKSGGGSTFLLLLAVLATMYLMFDPVLRQMARDAVGVALDPVLDPVPMIWVLVVVGSIMVLANTIVRHFFTDWVGLARTQEVMRTFQKEFSEARKSNNLYKIKRLGEMQPELMKMQADLSTQQMKPMILTMIVVIPIFAWLLHHVDPVAGVCDTFLEVPWAGRGTWCADDGTDWVGFIPRWIALYTLFTIPVGQVVQKALKLWEFRHVDLDQDGVPAGKVA